MPTRSIAGDSQWCAAWEHLRTRGALAEAGFATCADHRSQENDIRRFAQQLERVAAAVQRYGATRPRHGSRAVHFVQEAVEWFLDQELAGLGLRLGSGLRRVSGYGEEELDIIGTFLEEGDGNWSYRLRMRDGCEDGRLALHVEVKYRSSGSGDAVPKALADYRKLLRSVEAARERGEKLPWTGVVLLGPAWAPKADTILRRIHEVHHEYPAARVRLGDEDFWTAVDAVVMPHVLYKKYDLFETPALMEGPGARWPCLIPLPTAGDLSLRPLVIARAFLRHRILVLRGLARGDGEAWPESQSAAILGPYCLVPENESARAFVTLLLGDADPRRKVLFNSGADPVSGRFVAQPMDLIPGIRCSRGARFALRDAPGAPDSSSADSQPAPTTRRGDTERAPSRSRVRPGARRGGISSSRPPAEASAVRTGWKRHPARLHGVRR